MIWVPASFTENSAGAPGEQSFALPQNFTDVASVNLSPAMTTSEPILPTPGSIDEIDGAFALTTV